ncbi:hypothetical protein ACPPVV_08165 [Rhodanobacter sp. Col0626]|uniref:hypothetical protein n=1 Tax=Rhodanobacter sp. Col0626 TaxID=3415679 RepID=UPI003CFB2C51
MSVSGTQNISFSTPVDSASDGSWMAALAKALSKAMTSLQNRMVADGKAMDTGGKSTSAGNDANTDLQVATQQYSLLVTAISTVMKSVGDADNTLVQKG